MAAKRTAGKTMADRLATMVMPEVLEAALMAAAARMAKTIEATETEQDKEPDDAGESLS